LRNLVFFLFLALPVRAAEPLVIVALGDSLTHGYGLPAAEGFVPALERWLAARSPVPVRVLNAGVSGDTSAGGLARLDWTLEGGADAVIVELGGNDLLRGLDPAATRAALATILERLGARRIPVLLAGLPGPPNYGADWKAAFDAIFPDLAARHGAVLYPNFLAALGPDPAAALPFLQADAIHPNAAGVERIVADIGPYVLRLVEARLAQKE
jgi:acyl-CoA thioesterase-1